jgi:putative PIN family toxin of toxin-antitoxin system
MIRVVLDTNVILAALLSRRGAAFEILQRLRLGEFRLALSNHLLLEYEEVLKRNAAMLALTHGDVDRFLNAICQAADCYQLPAPQPPRLPDPDDEPLLRLAETSGGRLITTHNLRHLRPASAYGDAVLLPRDFLRRRSGRPGRAGAHQFGCAGLAHAPASRFDCRSRP